jgi:anti-sigma factor RsiW
VNEKMPWWRRLRGNREVASCMEVGRVLQSYLDGQVDELTARRVGRHLEMCRRCGLEATTYAQIKTALARRGGDVDPKAVARLQAFGKELLASDPDDGSADPRRDEI